MLRFFLMDIDGITHTLTRPLSLTIRMDESIPADDCYVVFAYEPKGELKDIRIMDDDGLVFVGIVDEQEHFIHEKGRFLRISARSLAARLLDNEAMPECYNHPSAKLIYERHVAPFGIKRTEDDDAVYYGEQQVNKGMSQWTVLKNFCVACYSAIPRIGADGVLWMKGVADRGSVCFSDEGDGVVYTEISEKIKRCEEISRVNIKVNGDGYLYQMDHTEAIRRGIRRERYLNAVLASTPMTCADTMIQNGRNASYAVRLRCPGMLTAKMGCEAVVKNRLLGNIGGLYVSSVSYHMDQNGGTSTITLKRRNNGCGSQDM